MEISYKVLKYGFLRSSSMNFDENFFLELIRLELAEGSSRTLGSSILVIRRRLYTVDYLSYPRSKNTGKFRQESIENCRNVEAVFRSEIFRTFSDDFRPVPTGKQRKLTGIHWKKVREFSDRNTASTSVYFRCFPAGSGNFPASFLKDPAGSDGRNLRSGIVNIGWFREKIQSGFSIFLNAVLIVLPQFYIKRCTMKFSTGVNGKV